MTDPCVSRRRFAPQAEIVLCWLTGVVLARLIWPWIRVPLGETYGIASPAVNAGFNPATNLARTAAFAILPPLVIVVCCVFWRARMRDFFASNPIWLRDFKPSGDSKRLNALGLLLALFLGVLLAANLWGTKAPAFDWFHDGESLAAGLSFAHGQVPYRDYLFVHGLVQDPARAALAFSLFGKSIGSLRTVDNLTRALILALVAMFFWQIFRGRLVWVFSAMIALGSLIAATAVSSEKLPFSPVLIQIRELPTLLFLNVAALIARGLEEQKASRTGTAALMFSYAFVPASAFLISVDRALFLTLSMLIGFPMVLGGWPQRSRKIVMMSVLVGSLSGAALVFRVLGAGVPAFLEYLGVYLPKYNALVIGLEYPINSAAFLVSQVMLSGSTCFGTALLLKHFWRNETSFIEAWRAFCRCRFLEMTLLAMSVLWFGVALAQADTWHLRVATLPMYLSLFYLSIRYGLDPLVERTGKDRLFWRLGWACTLLAVLAGGARLTTGRVLSNWLPVNLHDQAIVPARTLAVADHMKTIMHPEDTFFATDSNASWYYLADRVCPARFPIAYLAAPPGCQQEIIESLKSRSVRFVLTRSGNRSDPRKYLLTRSSLRLLNQYIASAYEPLEEVGGIQIWERATPLSQFRKIR